LASTRLITLLSAHPNLRSARAIYTIVSELPAKT
jgi:hypothetical protein